MIFDLEKEALLASGIRDEAQIAVYQGRLYSLHEQFNLGVSVSHDPLTRAKQIFDWLWAIKPSRYQLHGNYRLTEVIDSQMAKETRVVGNCLGLTLLYNCLLRRTGLEPEALYLENAFGVGPHVLTVLRRNDSIIDIENIFSEGFDYKSHRDEPMRTVWGYKELVADIYHSRGNESFEKGELSEALNNYKMAIDLNPEYEKARFNMIILLDKMGMREESE